MSAKRLLLRPYIRLTRGLPKWLQSRRAQFATLIAGGYLVISVVSDIGGALNVLLPGPEPATPGDIEDMKSSILAELRAQGVILDDQAQSALDDALRFFNGVDDSRVNRATRLMQTAPPQSALSLFTEITEDYVRDHNDEDGAKAWRALGALAFPVDRDQAMAAYENARSLDPDDAYTHYRLGAVYNMAARLDDAKASNDLATRNAIKKGDLGLAAAARMNNAGVFRKRFMLDEAEAALLSAKDDFEMLGDRAGLAEAHLNLGDHYSLVSSLYPDRQFNPSGPEEHYNTAMAIGFELNDAALVSHAIYGLAGVWENRNDHFLAIELYGRALGFYEWSGEKGLSAEVFADLGRVALKMDNAEKARGYFAAALRNYNELKQPLQIGAVKFNMGLAYAFSEDLQRACKEFSEAHAMIAAAGDTPYVDEIERISDQYCSGSDNSATALRSWAEAQTNSATVHRTKPDNGIGLFNFGDTGVDEKPSSDGYFEGAPFDLSPLEPAPAEQTNSSDDT